MSSRAQCTFVFLCHPYSCPSSMTQCGCQSSSHYIYVLDRKKGKDKWQKRYLSYRSQYPSIAILKIICQEFHLQLIGQTIFFWEAAKYSLSQVLILLLQIRRENRNGQATTHSLCPLHIIANSCVCLVSCLQLDVCLRAKDPKLYLIRKCLFQPMKIFLDPIQSLLFRAKSSISER